MPNRKADPPDSRREELAQARREIAELKAANEALCEQVARVRKIRSAFKHSPGRQADRALAAVKQLGWIHSENSERLLRYLSNYEHITTASGPDVYLVDFESEQRGEAFEDCFQSVEDGPLEPKPGVRRVAAFFGYQYWTMLDRLYAARKLARRRRDEDSDPRVELMQALADVKLPRKALGVDP